MAFPLDPFNEQTDSMENYLSRFERMCVMVGLEPSKWAIKLSQGLRGKSYDIFARISPEELDQYDLLKNALLARFEGDGESYKQKFKSARKENGESYTQYVDRLKSYMNRWRTL